MTYSTLTFDVNDGVAVIMLNRPDAMNALTRTMAEELHDAAVRCESEDEIRAVLLTGNGKMFCAGGDLKTFHDQGEKLPGFLTHTTAMLHAAVVRFNQMDPPVVIAINGTAAGGGFSLALCGDFSFASDKAKFISAYTASGLTPDGSSTYFLAKHIGLLRAKELVMTNRLLTAQEACDWGLVSRVVKADELMKEALALAHDFAQGPTLAYGGSKRLLLSAYSESLEAQLEAEARSIVAMMRTDDGLNGLDAFLNKSKPAFKGS